MRIRTTVETLYQFDELSADAQQKALEELFDLNVSDEYWYEWVRDDIQQFGTVSGLGCIYGKEFDIDNGSYIHITDICCLLSEILANYDKASSEYPDIAKEVLQPFVESFTPREMRHLLTLEHKGYLETLSGQTSRERQGIRYTVEEYVSDGAKHCRALLDKLEDSWQVLIRDLEHYYVTSLQKEYEYQTSVEAIAESIRCNEYEFIENGTLP